MPSSRMMILPMEDESVHWFARKNEFTVFSHQKFIRIREDAGLFQFAREKLNLQFFPIGKSCEFATSSLSLQSKTAPRPSALFGLVGRWRSGRKRSAMSCTTVIGRKAIRNDRLLFHAIAGPDQLRPLPLRLVYSPVLSSDR